MADSAAARLLARWRRLSSLPGGAWLFSRLLSWWVPYTGTIRPRVRELAPGFARITMADRRGVRNHLNSIHAIALVNLGEVTSGLAMVTALPPGARSIVTGLTTEFLKKARGRLVSECSCQAPASIVDGMEQVVIAQITDTSGDVVARVRVTWRLGIQSS
jgi:acyl-coenzyme A thioesterase PaaI-like protein